MKGDDQVAPLDTDPLDQRPVAPGSANRLGRWFVPVTGGLLLLLVALLLLRGAAVQGWIQSVRVVSGSMAPQLYGPHYAATCPECGWAFRVGQPYAPTASDCTCPNCGCTTVTLPQSLEAGRRVWIDRWPKWTRRLRAWQSVAYCLPPDQETLAVKRIVARGPGRVELHEGDVFLDGRIQRKSLEQLQQVHQLVYDDRYRPRSQLQLPPRWQPRASNAQQHAAWSVAPSGYRFAAQPHAMERVQWLDYVQWTCWCRPFPPTKRTLPQPLWDHYAYNQTVTRQAMHRVGDLEIQCQVTCPSPGRVLLQLDDGLDCLELQLDAADAALCVTHNGADLPGAAAVAVPASHSWRVTFARCDRRVLVQLNGDLIVAAPYKPTVGPRRADYQPVALGAVGADATIRELRLYRDVYYFGPQGESDWTATETLGPDQCFLAGDNVPVSVDSRQFGPVPAGDLLGVVLPRGD